MNDYNQIKKYVKSSIGPISSNEFKDKNISYFYINKLLDDNIIERVSKGMYYRNDYLEDEYYILQQRCKNIVFSFNTALYFLNETEVTPYRVDVTVPNGYNRHSIPSDCCVHYVNRENLELGAEKIEDYYGNEIIIYNLERTICDIVRSNNTGLDVEHENKVIRESIMDNKVNYMVLMEYAEKLKCKTKLITMTEVLA